MFWEGVSVYEKGQEPAGRSRGGGAIGVGVRSEKVPLKSGLGRVLVAVVLNARAMVSPGLQ